jgi:hypothetical protein
MEVIDFAAIRERFPLADYVRRLDVRLRHSGSHLIGKCPIHHEQRGNAFSVHPETQKWRCWGKCNRGGDVVDLEQALGGGTLTDAAGRLGAQRVQRTQQLPKVPKQEPSPAITEKNPLGLPNRMTGEEIHLCVEAASRLLKDERQIQRVARHRDWKPETIRGLALEPSLGVDAKGRLCFLYETGCKRRWRDKEGGRQIRWAFGKPWLWRFGYIKQVETVFICEGETDAITLLDSGVEQDTNTLVVALPSASFHIDQWVPLFTEKRIIIATDSDEAGIGAARHAAAVLKKRAKSIGLLELERIADE